MGLNGPPDSADAIPPLQMTPEGAPACGYAGHGRARSEVKGDRAIC